MLEALDELVEAKRSVRCLHREVDVIHTSLVFDSSSLQLKTSFTAARSHCISSLCYGTPDKWIQPPSSNQDNDKWPNSLHVENCDGGFWDSWISTSEMRVVPFTVILLLLRRVYVVVFSTATSHRGSVTRMSEGTED